MPGRFSFRYLDIFYSRFCCIQSCCYSKPVVVEHDHESAVENQIENENGENRNRVVQIRQQQQQQFNGQGREVPMLNLGETHQQQQSVDGVFTPEISGASDTESEGNSGNLVSKNAGKKPKENKRSVPDVDKQQDPELIQKNSDALVQNSGCLAKNSNENTKSSPDVNVPQNFNIDLCRDLFPSLNDAIMIGRGGFASVYKSSYCGVPVAIKYFHMEHQSPISDDQKDAFKHELSVISQLDHKNIVKFYGACLKPGYRALVMEFVESNLQKLIEKKRNINLRDGTNKTFSLLNIFGIVKAVAGALEYLHSKGIVHRDLHPQNILISKDHCVKVVDVGISKVLQHSVSNDSKRGGIFEYLAPEIFNGSIHCKSDIFSLGIIACQLWTLDQTWKDLGQGRLCHKILSGERPNIPEDMPQNLRELITSCWHQDYKRRPSAHDVVKTCENEVAILAAQKNTKK